MRKRRLIILLSVIVVFVVVGLMLFRVVWISMFGEEEISGLLEEIPEQAGVVPPVEKGETDWPSWRGPYLDGKSAVAGIRKDWSGGLRKLWEVNYLCQGKNSVTWSSPVIQGKRLVVVGRDEGRDLIFCLNAENGDLIWFSYYKAKTNRSHGSGARATPFIDYDMVYTFGRGGDLACWRLDNGRLVWRKNVKDSGGKEPRWGFSSSPLVYGDKVFVQGGGSARAIAYNKTTGAIAWKSMRGSAGYAAPTLADLGEGIRLLIFHGGGLSCLEPDNGKEWWFVPWETNYDVNASTPAVGKNAIFITSGYNKGCQAIEATNFSAKVIWRNKTIASQHSDPIIISGFIYGYSGQSDQNRGDFKCVELDSGEERWSTGEIGWGTVIHVDGHLLCMDIEGNLFLVKPSPDAFTKVTEFRGALGDIKHPAWTVPVVANNRLYLRYMQKLICYEIKDLEKQP